jgi:hypothetical protein
MPFGSIDGRKIVDTAATAVAALLLLLLLLLLLYSLSLFNSCYTPSAGGCSLVGCSDIFDALVNRWWLPCRWVGGLVVSVLVLGISRPGVSLWDIGGHQP